jgi:hypothetical protein
MPLILPREAIVFTAKHLQTYQVGLTFFGIFSSNFLAVVTMPWWKKRLAAQADPKTGIITPEARLGPAKLGCFLTPTGLFIFAFTAYKEVHWIGPVIGSTIFGMGTFYLFFSIFIYTTTNWRPVAASALGANSLVRCTMAAVFPLFADQMVNRLTPTGAVALLAGLNCLMVSLLFSSTSFRPARLSLMGHAAFPPLSRFLCPLFFRAMALKSVQEAVSLLDECNLVSYLV